MANLRLFSILFLVLALSVTLSSATWKSKSAAASPSKSAAASVSKSAAASPSPSASASVQPTPSVAQNNDFNCPFPDRYYTKAAITRLLYPESISLSTREATLLVYVNIDPNPGAPNFFLVANISGLNILKYNSSLGTLQGFFYVKFGSTYDLNAVYTYNIRGDDDPLVGYNTFCLHFPEDSNVPQYYRGDITADNVATGTYIETKATNSKNPSGLPPGFASRFEYFWDVNDQVINCLTDFDTTGVARVSLMNCIYYKPSNIDPNAAAAAAATAEASDAQRRRRDTGERYLQVGPLSRVNEQLIDPEYRHYFPVSVSE